MGKIAELGENDKAIHRLHRLKEKSVAAVQSVDK
jgi:hypothetical protein